MLFRSAPGGNTGEAIDDTYFSIENLLGSMFNDILIGDDNDNVLDGFGSNMDVGDFLTGNGGGDTFVFGGARLTVTDFSVDDSDLIDLSHSFFVNGRSPGEAEAALDALLDVSTGDTIDFGDGHVLTLTGVIVNQLSTDSFILSSEPA